LEEFDDEDWNMGMEMGEISPTDVAADVDVDSEGLCVGLKADEIELTSITANEFDRLFVFLPWLPFVSCSSSDSSFFFFCSSSD